MLPYARHADLAIIPWGVIGGGALTGKYLQENNDTKRLKEGSTRLSERSIKIAQEVVQVAQELGCPPLDVAINWVRQQKGLFIPLIGARNTPQLKDWLASLELQIPTQFLQRLHEASKIELGFPHDFLASDNVKDVAFGGSFNKLDKHHLH
jgi:aryl-alcohol dehydrogenase-like predicted oxidoreductase